MHPDECQVVDQCEASLFGIVGIVVYESADGCDIFVVVSFDGQVLTGRRTECACVADDLVVFVPDGQAHGDGVVSVHGVVVDHRQVAREDESVESVEAGVGVDDEAFVVERWFWSQYDDGCSVPDVGSVAIAAGYVCHGSVACAQLQFLVSCFESFVEVVVDVLEVGVVPVVPHQRTVEVFLAHLVFLQHGVDVELFFVLFVGRKLVDHALGQVVVIE